MKSVLLERLNTATGLHPSILKRLFDRSPYTYKIYRIPKRTGGFRTIAQPARETKLVQNWLLANVYSRLPIHSCATAYCIGASIKKNASIHKESNYLVKLDFRNFFPSIKRVDLIHLFSAHLLEDYGHSDIGQMATISSFQPKDLSPLCLSVGAPSSPLLANAIMYEFDNLTEVWCRDNGINYSRYADDLAFSTDAKGMSKKIEEFVKESLLKISYPRLELNADKTTFLSKKHRRRVTGLILDNDGNVSLGRSRKREISSLVNSFSYKSLSEEECSRLQGLLAFAKDVEPLFVLSMNKKYGNDVLEETF